MSAPMRAAALAALLSAALSASSSAQAFWEVGNQLLTRPLPDAAAEMGYSLTVLDFDGDGVADLAVGSPFYDVQKGTQNGLVDFYRTTENGGLEIWGTVAFLFDDLAWTSFALVAGNFDDDPSDELAIGVPGYGVPAPARVGAVMVLHFVEGSFEQQDWTQANLFGDQEENGDEVGRSLAVGDFDGDGYDDLAIGVPLEDLGALADAGALHVVFGGPTGLVVGQFLTASHLEPGASAGGDQFAAALAAGDFDGDGIDDLAIGVPLRSVAGQGDAGEFRVAYGSPTGLTTVGAQRFDNGSFGFSIEADDRFGGVLAAGDFDGPAAFSCELGVVECADDLAIGVPNEDVGAVQDAGFVVVAFGDEGAGLVTAGAQGFDQAALGFSVETGDQFGAALVAVNLDGDRTGGIPFSAVDLAIGVPNEDVAGGATDQGVVHLLRGVPGAGLDLVNHEIEQQFAGYASAPGSTADRFGWSVAVADFDADGESDLAVGIPLLENPPLGDAGGVQVLYGALFADGFERGSADGWSFVTEKG